MRLEKLHRQIRHLAEHRGIRRYGANTLWMLAEKGGRLILGFLVGIYVARKLGPAQYGLLNYAISFIALFSVLVTLGMDPVLVRELVRRPGDSARILGCAMAIKAAGFCVMASSLGALLIFSGIPSQEKLLFAILLGGYAFQIFQVFDFSFQARVLSSCSAVSQISALALVSIARIVFAWKGAPLWCFALAESMYLALSAFGYMLFFRWNGGSLRNLRFDREEILHLVRESFPLFLAAFAVMLSLRSDQLLVTWLLGSAANGQYAVALRLTEVFFLFPIVIADSFFPAIVGASSTSLLLCRRRAEQLMRILFYFALAILIPGIAAGTVLITRLYGEAYRESAFLYGILLLQILLVYPGQVSAKWYLAENMQKISMGIAFCNCALSLVLNYLMIRIWNLTGIAVAAFLLNCATYLGFPLMFRKGRTGVRLFLRAMLPIFR